MRKLFRPFVYVTKSLGRRGLSFWRDIRDQDGMPQAGSAADVVNVLSLLCLVFGGIAGLISNLDVILKLFPALPSSSIPLVCALVGLSWAIGLVVLKSIVSEPDSNAGKIWRYRYGQPPRQLAKLVLLPLMIIVVTAAGRLYRQITPLPAVLYGVLRNQDGPLRGVTVYVISADGQNLTRTSWPSGSNGFYMIETTKRVPRSAHLTVDWPGCAEVGPQLLLRIADEISEDSLPFEVSGLSPVFRHTVTCERFQ